MDSLFQLEYKKQDEEYTMPEAHYHDYYEIYYLYSGERHYLLEDRIYHIHQGDLVLIPPILSIRQRRVEEREATNACSFTLQRAF